MEATHETVLYQGGNATVTNRRVTLDNREYPLSGMRAVSVLRPIVRRAYGVVALVLGVLLTIVGYIVWDGVLLSPMVGGLALIVAGLAIVATARERYTVRLHEQNGSVVTLDMPDGDQTRQVVDAINSALQRDDVQASA